MLHARKATHVLTLHAADGDTLVSTPAKTSTLPPHEMGAALVKAAKPKTPKIVLTIDDETEEDEEEHVSCHFCDNDADEAIALYCVPPICESCADDQLTQCPSCLVYAAPWDTDEEPCPSCGWANQPIEEWGQTEVSVFEADGIDLSHLRVRITELTPFTSPLHLAAYVGSMPLAQAAAEFYLAEWVLAHLGPHARLDPIVGRLTTEARRLQRQAIAPTYEPLMAYSIAAITAEYRHHISMRKEWRHADRSEVFCLGLAAWRHDPDTDRLRAIAAHFREVSAGSYCGENWARCAELVADVLDDPRSFPYFFDRLINEVHNGGPFLNKLPWFGTYHALPCLHRSYDDLAIISTLVGPAHHYTDIATLRLMARPSYRHDIDGIVADLNWVLGTHRRPKVAVPVGGRGPLGYRPMANTLALLADAYTHFIREHPPSPAADGGPYLTLPPAFRDAVPPLRKVKDQLLAEHRPSVADLLVHLAHDAGLDTLATPGGSYKPDELATAFIAGLVHSTPLTRLYYPPPEPDGGPVLVHDLLTDTVERHDCDLVLPQGGRLTPIITG